MRVLDIANNFPYPPNDGERLPVFSYLQSLSQKGVQYTLLCSIARVRKDWEEGLKVFENLGVEVVGVEDRRGGGMGQAWRCLSHGVPWVNRAFEPALADKARELLARGGWDIVQAETVLAGQHLPKRIGFPSLLMALDCLSEGHHGDLWRSRRRLKDWVTMKKIAALERSVYRRFDMITAVSIPDAAAIAKLAPGKPVEHLPNGVDLEVFKQATEQEEGELVVFTGAMDFTPNVDAMEWFVADIWPAVKKQRPDARLAIVGKEPTPAIQAMTGDSSITVTGRVDSTAAWLAKAAVVVAPIRLGTGMKNKILEAAAVGKAIVTTSKGSENINLSSDEDLQIADTASDFSNQITSLLNEQSKRRQLGHNAHEKIKDRYSRQSAAGRLMNIYAELVNKK